MLAVTNCVTEDWDCTPSVAGSAVDPMVNVPPYRGPAEELEELEEIKEIDEIVENNIIASNNRISSFLAIICDASVVFHVNNIKLRDKAAVNPALLLTSVTPQGNYWSDCGT